MTFSQIAKAISAATDSATIKSPPSAAVCRDVSSDRLNSQGEKKSSEDNGNTCPAVRGLHNLYHSGIGLLFVRPTPCRSSAGGPLQFDHCATDDSP